MDNNKITTCNKKPTLLTQRDAYLTLIAEEIRSHGVGYHLGDVNLPSDLAVDYLKFNRTYWDIFETGLRNFDGKSLSDMDDGYKHEIIDIYTNQTEKAIQDAIDYINGNIASKRKNYPLNGSKIFIYLRRFRNYSKGGPFRKLKKVVSAKT
jgi:hypothetical protein